MIEAVERSAAASVAAERCRIPRLGVIPRYSEAAFLAARSTSRRRGQRAKDSPRMSIQPGNWSSTEQG